MQEIDPAMQTLGSNKQLNHYFIGGDTGELYRNASSYLDGAAREQLEHIVRARKDVSVRTRQRDDIVLLVAKAAVDDTTSANGIARIEFESVFPVVLDELDALVRSAGFDYQAKWSREREEYACRGTTICLDKNAGYGYLAEFERIVTDEQDATTAKEELRALMEELGTEELPQDRLERMFAYYNEHWPEYYGTDNIFTIL